MNPSGGYRPSTFESCESLWRLQAPSPPVTAPLLPVCRPGGPSSSTPQSSRFSRANAADAERVTAERVTDGEAAGGEGLREGGGGSDEDAEREGGERSGIHMGFIWDCGGIRMGLRWDSCGIATRSVRCDDGIREM